MNDTVEDARALLKRLEKSGVELFLWKSAVMLDPKVKIARNLAMELVRLKSEIRAELVRMADLERSKPGLPHKWLLKRGHKDKHTGKLVPAYLACGPFIWFSHCMKTVQLFASSSEERDLWIVLDQEHVGPFARNEGGVLVATQVKLPEGSAPVGPEGTEVEVTAACDSCLTPGAPPGEVDAMIKSED